MPWIKLDTSFYRNPKTANVLADKNGPAAIIALQEMWCWAGDSDSPDAREGYVPDAMATRLGLTDKLAPILENAGFIHRNGSGWHIHDWDSHQGALLERRARDRDNARARRRKETTE